MAKAPAREYVWLQCTDCGELNYRVPIRVAGGGGKLEITKFCRHTRTHTLHKSKKK